MNDISYNNWNSMTDKSITGKIGAFVQHHRLSQNRSQTDVSQAAGISRSTLSLLERGEKINLNSLIQVLRVLDLLYVLDVFEVTDEISPLEYVKLQKKSKKYRASGSSSMLNEPDPTW